MAFERIKPEDLDRKRHELAGRLDDIFLNERDINVLEGSIRFMGQNTRERLLRALALAERNSPGVTKLDDSLESGR